ncbi:NADase-type glycan-binding domain-containing protein [Streptomyces sp. NPDC006463]|uniref:zinc ribbon domain-containing protein n=1 Tax=Streptomyces sp. NPDC006463 TaxID=3364746 RepID=UPI0036B270D3
MTDDFCGNCGAYLGWSDSTPTRGAAGTTPDAPARPASPGDGVGAGAGAPEHAVPERVDSRPPAAAEPGPPAPSAAEPAPSAPVGAQSAPSAPSAPSGAAPAEGGEDRTARRARGPESGPQTPPAPSSASTSAPASASGPGTAPAVRPPAAPEAVAPQASASPQPVRPAKAVTPRPVVRPPVVGDDVAGVPCPACGTPNPSDRRFCRRCAAPLTPSAAPAPLPWWRTIWPLRRRTRAGSGRMVRFLVILAVVLALCAAGFLMLPAGRHLIEDTRDKLGKAKAVTPARVEASAELPGHPVSHSTDGLTNRYWGVPGPGASATYTFAKPFRLVDVIITNGASSSPEEYANQGRALQIDMEVTARDGRKVRKQLTLSDKPGPQTFPTGISDATAIRLTLDAPAGSAPDRHLALAEVEFFQRS